MEQAEKVGRSASPKLIEMLKVLRRCYLRQLESYKKVYEFHYAAISCNRAQLIKVALVTAGIEEG